MDTVETPFGKKESVLGGAAVYFSAAARLYTQVNLVGIVGADFPKKYLKLIEDFGVNTEGLEMRSGQTFSWHGKYEYDMNIRHSIDTRLGLFSEFNPVLPDSYKDSPYLFLANIDPDIQLSVLNQSKAKFTMMDTMDYWINNKRERLDNVISRVNLVLMNDYEARQYAEEYSLVQAAQKILSMGPNAAVIKKGEHGALLVTDNDCFVIPAYPLCNVKDPTGAGDSFAGGFLGYLASSENKNGYAVRNAIVHGSIVASYVVEDFSLNSLINLNLSKMKERYEEFSQLVMFEPWPEIKSFS